MAASEPKPPPAGDGPRGREDGRVRGLIALVSGALETASFLVWLVWIVCAVLLVGLVIAIVGEVVRAVF
jgi:hypothetical protein